MTVEIVINLYCSYDDNDLVGVCVRERESAHQSTYVLTQISHLKFCVCVWTPKLCKDDIDNCVLLL